MTPPPLTLRPTSELPAETAELLEQLRCESPRGPADDWALAGLTKHLSEGTQGGFLLLGPNDEAICILLDRITPIGHRVSFLMAPGFRSEASTQSALVALDSAPELHPVVGLRVMARSPPPETIAERIELRGFRYFGRVDLELPEGTAFPAQPPGNPLGLRPVQLADTEALARLMRAAYSTDPYDVAIFLERADLLEDARVSVDAILSGKFGPWIPTGSFAQEIEGELRGAVLTVRNDGGLIAELLVDPRSRRVGLGRALLEASVRGLREAGERPVRLVYTRPNRQAESLYVAMGFRPPVPEFVGGDWVNLACIGHPELADELRLTASGGAMGSASHLPAGASE
ncbi:MAG: GNAT family N-acetyltransferase [Thermoplasmata archaeon]|nr:GNAT family N-acetyltransferase [Thermoplasmata archaeon]